MPWIAEYEGGEKTPHQVPIKTDAECVECGRTLRVKRRGKDGTSRHFFHKGKIGQHGEGGGSGSYDCESVAESDKHRVWKSWAVDALLRAFGDDAEFAAFDKESKRELFEEKRLKAPSSDKEWRVGDVVFEFEDRDEQLGEGLVVEVQHKNESKDLDLTTEDYTEQDYSVVWMYEDDFGSDRCRLNELDIRKRAFDAAWPVCVPNPGDWFSQEGIKEQYPEEEWKDRIPPRSPREYDIPVSFGSSGSTTPYYKPSLGEWIEHVWEDTELVPVPEIPATLPADYFDDKCREIWKAQEWPEIFKPGYNERELIDDGIVNPRKSPPVPGTIPLWREVEWSLLFQDNGGYECEEYIEEVRGSLDGDGTLALKFPPDVASDLVYESLKGRYAFTEAVSKAELMKVHWEQTDWKERFSGCAGTIEADRQNTSISATFCLSKWLSDDFLILQTAPKTATLTPNSNQPIPPATDYLIPEPMIDVIRSEINIDRIEAPEPDRPPGPFDDVQCWNCGCYWYSDDERDECQRCGVDVDWEWNIQTGRIPPSAAPWN